MDFRRNKWISLQNCLNVAKFVSGVDYSSQTFYQKANEKTEKIMKVLKMIIVKVIPMVLLPLLLRFIIATYVLESEEGSQMLAARVWQVHFS